MYNVHTLLGDRRATPRNVYVPWPIVRYRRYVPVPVPGLVSKQRPSLGPKCPPTWHPWSIHGGAPLTCGTPTSPVRSSRLHVISVNALPVAYICYRQHTTYRRGTGMPSRLQRWAVSSGPRYGGPSQTLGGLTNCNRRPAVKDKADD